MKKRKLVYGVGINDADYVVQPKIDGKQVRCPFYVAWASMIERCYSDRLQTRRPTYADCIACKEWLIFSNFKRWMERQDYEGKQLDKDIIVSGNKTYSPDTCVFISAAVNSLLNSNDSQRGEYKQGVCWNKRCNKFQSNIRLYGIKKALGLYDTEQGAYAAYVAAKAAYIREVADTQEPKVRAGLYRHAAELENTLK